MPKEKKTTRKKGTQTVKALLQDSDRQVLRFNRLTPLPGIVCHLSAGRERFDIKSNSEFCLTSGWDLLVIVFGLCLSIKVTTGPKSEGEKSQRPGNFHRGSV